VLAVERLDRLWTRDGRLLRLPQKGICQASSVPPNLKHQTDGGPDNQAIMSLLKASDTPTQDQAAYLKAQLLTDPGDGRPCEERRARARCRPGRSPNGPRQSSPARGHLAAGDRIDEGGAIERAGAYVDRLSRIHRGGGEDGTFRHLPSKLPISGSFRPGGTPVANLAGTLTGTSWHPDRRSQDGTSQVLTLWLPSSSYRKDAPRPLDKSWEIVVHEAISDADPTGTDWSDTEVDLIVADNFDMLRLERAGEPYVKAHATRHFRN
jgi:hypothetical protein